ncbi:MAG: hypothetical protein KC636_23200, partial [Myxococcales bacterium]|nr:hypothetical protein [Myxococcales bacterium]
MNNKTYALLGACALLLACGGGEDPVTTGTDTAATETDGTETDATSPTTSDATLTTAGPTDTIDPSDTDPTTEPTTDPYTDTGPCPAGEELCDNVCVNIDGDSENCGGCGIACGVGEFCVLGSCEPMCDPGTIVCGDACVDLQTDPEHCGDCNNACDAESGCVDGTCEFCPDGDACDDLCTDFNTDPENCGGCGIPCMAPGMCVDGVCEGQCDVGETACGDVCADLEVDPLHCGDCDTACPEAMFGVSECLDSLCQLTCPDGYIPNDDMSDCTNCGTATIFASQPISYWRLGETMGMTTAVDQMAIKDGTHFEIELGIPGVAVDGDTAARFGNTNLARVNIPTYPAMPDAAVSIEFWVDAPDTPGVDETAFSYAVANQNNELLVFNLANINLYIGGASVPTGVNVLDDSWHHVVVT